MPYMMMWAPYSVLLFLIAYWCNCKGRLQASYGLGVIGAIIILVAFYKDHDNSLLHDAVGILHRAIVLWLDDLADRAIQLLRDLTVVGS